MNKRRWTFWGVFSLVTLGIASGIYRWIERLSKEPTEEKVCDFVFPKDTHAPIEIQLEDMRPFSQYFYQQGGYANDASCLNKTAVYGKVWVTSASDVLEVLSFAKEYDLMVSAAGQQHTMGGHTFSRGGIVMDMKKLNKMSVNQESKILTVESGATWEDIQEYIDPMGLSVDAMQSINIFTVGGTISVNAHGMDPSPGHIAPTIRSVKIALANGEIRKITLENDPELFSGIVGGYGLLGIILEAEIQLVDNEAYELSSAYMDYADFAMYYADNIENNNDIGLFYGRLSVAPHSYLTEVVAHVYAKTDIQDELPAIERETDTQMNRFVINMSKSGGMGRWARWMLEKYAKPQVRSCISRNNAMSQPESYCLVSRNQEMSDSMQYLKNTLADTDILNEYFVPREQMVPFVDGLRDIVQKNNANLLNVSIRIVEKDTVSDLPYATEDMFAYVLYFNQALTPKASENIAQTTRELIDLSTSLGGTFYLPYQTVYSDEQLKTAYPNISKFLSKKREYDPEGIFSHKWYERYKDL